MQETKRRSDSVGEPRAPHQYGTWCNHLYPAQASGCTLTICNNVQNTVATQTIITSGTNSSVSSATGSSFEGYQSWAGSALRNAVVHAPGVIRDYLIAAGQSINLFPVYSYQTFEVSDANAIASDAVVVYGDVNQALVNNWSQFVELVKSNLKEEATTTEVPNVERSGKRDAEDTRVVGRRAE
jgi:hypothetical protein